MPETHGMLFSDTTEHCHLFGIQLQQQNMGVGNNMFGSFACCSMAGIKLHILFKKTDAL